MSESQPSTQERNKAIALRFKKSQGTPQQEETMREVLAPAYQRVRGGMFHLEQNAHGAGFHGPGKFLRTAFPDRVDAMEDVIAEGDRVGLLFRLTATHRADFLGVPATGRRVETHEFAILRIVDGRMVEGWFMADEIALLRQFGAGFPRRPDGRQIAPPVTGSGEEAAAVAQRLKSGPLASATDRQRLAVAQAAGGRAQRGELRRAPFQNLAACAGAARDQDFARAFPDCRERINVLMAEGDRVWMRSTLTGTHTAPFYGVPATGRRIEIPQLTIARFAGGQWRDTWQMADELGLLLQLGATRLLARDEERRGKEEG